MAKDKNVPVETEAAAVVETSDPPKETAVVTITKAPMSPVPVHVNGLGLKKIQIGEPTTVNVEVLGALDCALGVEYEVADD